MSQEAFQALAQAMSMCYREGKDLEGEQPPEPIPCRAGVSSFWVNWKGNMTPCVFMEQPAIPVFETGFGAAWEFVKGERDKLFMPAKCTACGKRNVCSVCAASVLTENGSLQQPPEYVCRMTDEKMRLMDGQHSQGL